MNSHLRNSCSRPLQWWLFATFAVLELSACGAQSTPSFDSQSHWLRACEHDADCGPYECLCGTCSSTCESNDDCSLATYTPATCQAPETLGAVCGDGDITPSTSVCVPDCNQSPCISDRATAVPALMDCTDPNCSSTDAVASDSSILHATLQPLPALEPVPACPELASTTSLPALFFTTDVADYEGPATVTQVDGGNVGLTANNAVNEQFLLRFNGSAPVYLPLGQRVNVLVKNSGEGSAKRTLLVIRNDSDELLLVSHAGDDQLYQQGLFSTPDVIGATLTLRMLCQSAVSDGCFEQQVQANYEGIFSSDDDQLTTDGAGLPVNFVIAGRTFALTFDSSSVDGTSRKASCDPSATPGRYLSFSLLAL